MASILPVFRVRLKTDLYAFSFPWIIYTVGPTCARVDVLGWPKGDSSGYYLATQLVRVCLASNGDISTENVFYEWAFRMKVTRGNGNVQSRTSHAMMIMQCAHWPVISDATITHFFRSFRVFFAWKTHKNTTKRLFQDVKIDSWILCTCVNLQVGNLPRVDSPSCCVRLSRIPRQLFTTRPALRIQVG